MLATATIATAAGCASPPGPTGPREIAIGSGGVAGVYDPRSGIQAEGDLLTQALFDTVLEADGDPGEISADDWGPWLATEWTFSDDRREGTFTIRDGVTFSDGEALDAPAVAASLNAWLASPTGMQQPLAVAQGVEIEATDEDTLVFRADLPLGRENVGPLFRIPIVSPAALDDPEILAAGPVGSGPYVLDQEQTVPGVRYRLTRNETYWNRESFPYDVVTIDIFEDQVASLNALKSGQIDATQIDVGSATAAEADGFEITQEHGQYWMLFFGDRAGEVLPAVADRRVREAMNLAFDRDAINESIDLGRGLASSQIFGPDQIEYVEGGDDRYGFDPERARELLAEAGYADGFDLVIPTSSYTAAMEPIVEQSLADIGVRVTWDRFSDLGAAFAPMQSGKYPVIILFDYFVSIRNNYLKPTGLFSGWGYDDPRVSALLETMQRGTPDEEAEAGRELGEIVLDEAWFVSFSQPATLWAHTADVDMRLTPMVGAPALRFFTPAE